MGKCELCEDDGSRMLVNHAELGKIMVCRDCWKDIYNRGQSICEGTSSGRRRGGGCPACK